MNLPVVINVNQKTVKTGGKMKCITIVSATSLLLGLLASNVNGQDKDASALYQSNLVTAAAVESACSQLDSSSVIETFTQESYLAFSKTMLDAGFDVHFMSCTNTLQYWKIAVETGYDIDSMVTMTKRVNFETGQTLVCETFRSCIKKAMKKAINSKRGVNSKLMDLVMDYYALYNQLYEFDVNPTGSYQTAVKKVEDIKSNKVRIASKLGLLLE